MSATDYPRCAGCGADATYGEWHGGWRLCTECLDMDVQAWDDLDEIMEWD